MYFQSFVCVCGLIKRITESPPPKSHCYSVASDSSQPHRLEHTQAFLSFTMSWSLLRLMAIESVMPYNHLILHHPLHYGIDHLVM